jgi:hypothetical protein
MPPVLVKQKPGVAAISVVKPPLFSETAQIRRLPIQLSL